LVKIVERFASEASVATVRLQLILRALIH